MPSTPASLLQRLRQAPTPEQWTRFVDLYAPVIQHWAARAGLQDADAADLLQDVFAVLLKKLPEFEYDPSRSFSAWLRQVCVNVWRGKARQRLPAALGAGQEPAIPDPAEQFWNRDYQAHLARRAMEVMQRDFAPTTWQACWKVVVEGLSPADVAKELGLSVGAVYAARFRVLARLREELEGMLD